MTLPSQEKIWKEIVPEQSSFQEVLHSFWGEKVTEDQNSSWMYPYRFLDLLNSKMPSAVRHNQRNGEK